MSILIILVYQSVSLYFLTTINRSIINFNASAITCIKLLKKKAKR